MQVVSNTSPLSALSIIGRLGLLRSQFGTIRNGLPIFSSWTNPPAAPWPEI